MKGKAPSMAAGRRIAGLILVICAVLWASTVRAENWPRFRGPNGQGISHAKSIPSKWTEGDCNWKIKLPGTGHSSPVVWDETVFLTCSGQDSGSTSLLSVRVSDGKIVWEKQFKLSVYRMNRLNDYAAATPAVDAENVYTVWSTSEQTLVAAFDHKGEEIWKRTFPGVKSQHGPCSSPIVVGDIVVFTHEHEDSADRDARSFWFALDRKTGQTRWRLPRQTGPKTSYSTPCLFPSSGPGGVIVFTSRSHGITGVHPESGKVAWEADSAHEARVVCSPAVGKGMIFSSCGNGSAGKYVIAVRPGDTDVPAEAYRITGRAASYVPTPLAADGLLFTCHDRGQVSCLRVATGELLWSEKPAGRYYGSPVWVDGKVYVITTDGDVVVVRAAAQYELLGVNPLGEKSQATPAVANGRMYLRTDSQLISIGGKK